MPRSARAFGLIRCRADSETLAEIASVRGLRIEPAEKPSHYYLVETTDCVRELESALFAAIAYDLDRAVAAGRIRSWSALVRPMA